MKNANKKNQQTKSNVYNYKYQIHRQLIDKTAADFHIRWFTLYILPYILPKL